MTTELVKPARTALTHQFLGLQHSYRWHYWFLHTTVVPATIFVCSSYHFITLTEVISCLPLKRHLPWLHFGYNSTVDYIGTSDAFAQLNQTSVIKNRFYSTFMGLCDNVWYCMDHHDPLYDCLHIASVSLSWRDCCFPGCDPLWPLLTPWPWGCLSETYV